MSIEAIQRLFSGGPAPRRHKLLRRELLKMGTQEKDLPRILRDTVVAKTKSGPIGAITLRNMSGLSPTPATKIVRTFEQNVGGKQEVAEKLMAVEDTLTEAQRALLVLLKSSTSKSLARLMAETGVEPVGVMNAYAKGCVVLGKINAAIEAHRNLPALIKDLYRHALDKESVCKVCVGLKEVPTRAGVPTSAKVVCPQCDGTGVSLVSSKHKEFAHRQILEVTKLVNEKAPMVQVTQQTAVVTGGRQAGFFEKMLDAADGIAFPDQKQRIVDAEVVEATEEGEEVDASVPTE